MTENSSESQNNPAAQPEPGDGDQAAGLDHEQETTAADPVVAERADDRPEQPRPAKMTARFKLRLASIFALSKGALEINFLRGSLATWFLLFAFFVALGMRPLPDEPPRINFFGLFCTVGALVIAVQFMLSRYRLFLIGILPFLFLCFRYLNKRIRFLEMMLEPNLVERTLQWCLPGIGLILILMLIFSRPKSMFPRKAGDYKAPEPLFFKNGIPF